MDESNIYIRWRCWSTLIRGASSSQRILAPLREGSIIILRLRKDVGHPLRKTSLKGRWRPPQELLLSRRHHSLPNGPFAECCMVARWCVEGGSIDRHHENPRLPRSSSLDRSPKWKGGGISGDGRSGESPRGDHASGRMGPGGGTEVVNGQCSSAVFLFRSSGLHWGRRVNHFPFRAGPWRVGQSESGRAPFMTYGHPAVCISQA